MGKTNILLPKVILKGYLKVFLKVLQSPQALALDVLSVFRHFPQAHPVGSIL